MDYNYGNDPYGYNNGQPGMNTGYTQQGGPQIPNTGYTQQGGPQIPNTGYTQQGGYPGMDQGYSYTQQGGYPGNNQGNMRTGFPDMNQNIGMTGYGNTQNMPPQPPEKKSNVGLIIGIIVAALILVGGIIGGVVVARSGGGTTTSYSNTDEVIMAFFESYDALDKDKMKTCFPAASNTEAFIDTNIALATTKKELYTFKIDQITYNAVEMTSTELDTFKTTSNMKKIQKGYNVHIEVPCDQKVNGTGVTVTDIYDANVACIKDKYYIVNISNTDIKIETADNTTTGGGTNTNPPDGTDPTTETSTDPTTETSTEPATNDPTNAGGQGGLGDASGLSDDVMAMQFKLDGKVYQIPFDFKELTDAGWTYDTADWEEDDDYYLDPGSDTLCVFSMTHPNYPGFRLYVGFTNYGNGNCAITDCSVSKVNFDISWGDESYPEVILPKGITFGSNVNDVVSAYGQPNDEPYYSDTLEYYEYEYTDSGYDNYVSIYVYNDGGVKEIDMRTYK